MKVLLIDDDALMCEILQKVLEENGFSVEISHEGEEGLFLVQELSPDVVVLDVMMPKLDGLTVLKRLRELNPAIPVLLLTARSGIQDRIVGLDLGADDYLPKPFDYGEFLSRLRALIRRGKGHGSSVLTVGDLKIDMPGKTVTRAGQPISLTVKEYNLLEYLAMNAGKVVSRIELFEHLYPSDFESDSNVLDVFVTYLRNKIDKPFPEKLIHTVRGVGYVMRTQNSS